MPKRSAIRRLHDGDGVGGNRDRLAGQAHTGIRRGQDDRRAEEPEALLALAEVHERLDRSPRHREGSAGLVALDLDAREPRVAQRMDAPTEREKLAVPREKASVEGRLELLPRELRCLEGQWRLRVGKLLRVPAESCELAATALADGLTELG